MGEHGVDAGHRQRLGDVDRDDARVRVRAADRVAPEHPRRPEVARVGELARRLRDPVGARDDLADPADLEPPGRRGHGLSRARTPPHVPTLGGEGFVPPATRHRRYRGRAHVSVTGPCRVRADSSTAVGPPPRAHAPAASLTASKILRVAGAAAEVAGQRLADLVVARARHPREQVGRGDDQPRRAEAALDGARLDERLLDPVQLVLVGEPLDRDAPRGRRPAPRARGRRRPACRRAGPSTTRIRPARTRSSSRADRAARGARRAGSRRARRRPRAPRR